MYLNTTLVNVNLAIDFVIFFPLEDLNTTLVNVNLKGAVIGSGADLHLNTTLVNVNQKSKVEDPPSKLLFKYNSC